MKSNATFPRPKPAPTSTPTKAQTVAYLRKIYAALAANDNTKAKAMIVRLGKALA